MYNENELVFPQRLIPALLHQRGALWQELVEEILRHPPGDLQRSAFVLLIARLAGCATCHADTLRALRGCAPCARQAVQRFHGDDRQLLMLFDQASQDVRHYVEQG